MSNELSNVNALVYHISNLSKEWSLTNPFSLMLRSLLLNQNEEINQKSLRTKQDFHFIAKIINDELNNNEIKKNNNEILILVDKYLKQKQQNIGNTLIRFLFYIVLLKLLEKDLHYFGLRIDKIKEFLSGFRTEDKNLINMHKILCMIYGSNCNSEEKDVIDDDLNLCISILHTRLILMNESKRDKSILIDYYLKQNKIETIDTSSTSDRSKIRLLEMAVILKAATGKGLYIPEIEKEQYLSSFTKSIFREKYIGILKDSNYVKLKGLRVPNWSVVLLFFVLEAIIFSLPNYVESISLEGFSIKTTALLRLPIWLILVFNGLIICLYILVNQRKISKKLSDERWK